VKTAQSLIQSTCDRLGIKKEEKTEKGDGSDLSIAASNFDKIKQQAGGIEEGGCREK